MTDGVQGFVCGSDQVAARAVHSIVDSDLEVLGGFGLNLEGCARDSVVEVDPRQCDLSFHPNLSVVGVAISTVEAPDAASSRAASGKPNPQLAARLTGSAERPDGDGACPPLRCVTVVGTTSSPGTQA